MTDMTREEAYRLALQADGRTIADPQGPDLPDYLYPATEREWLTDSHVFAVRRPGVWIGSSLYIAVSKSDGEVRYFTVGE